MAASVNPNSDPFRGGGRFNAGVPTSGPTGSIAAASTGGSLVGGVQGSTPMLARNNRGSNITVPYARVVMHPSGRTALPAPPDQRDPNQSTLGKPNGDIIIETEFLYSGRIAFILGRRGKTYSETGVDQIIGMEGMEANTQLINSRTQQMLYQFAVGGVDQHTMQRMCSLEYLKRYFHYVLRTKTIDLQKTVYAAGDPVPAKYKSFAGALSNGKMNDINGEAVLKEVANKEMGAIQAGSDAEKKAKKVEKSGIFAADDGPFLRGYTLETGTMPVRRNRQRASLALADHIAFECLEAELKNAGVLDWVPDGIVLSKLDSGGQDRLADDATDSRDGQLYNVTISGPAVTSTWTNDAKMEVLPLDKLYIVIIGDVWIGPDNKAATDLWTGGKYDETRKAAFAQKPDTFKDRQKKQGTVITNLRVERMTSSQMVSYSVYAPGNANSRCGLKLGKDVGEYIIGGWEIGKVLDSAAARAMPDGMSLVGSVKRARTSHAANVCVDIKWCSADELYRKYMNRGSKASANGKSMGTLRSRYDMQHRPLDPFNDKATRREASKPAAPAAAPAAASAAAQGGAP